jgi:hypothetical protein
MRLQLPEGQGLGIHLERLNDLAILPLLRALAGELLRIQISVDPCLQDRLAVSVDTLTLGTRDIECDAGRMMVGGKEQRKIRKALLLNGS